MATLGDVHKHYCNNCWDLYECECTVGFVPGSYRCPHCSSFYSDQEFLHAIGVSWDGRLPSIDAEKDQGMNQKESSAKLLMKPRTE